MYEIRIIFKDNTWKKYIANSTQFTHEHFLKINLGNEGVYTNLNEIKSMSIREVD